MKIRIAVRRGGEVRWLGESYNGPTYYGGPPPESGSWKVDVTSLSDYLNLHLANSTFGSSIDTFIFGFDIAELTGWGQFFTNSSNHISYRPKNRELLSVGQLNWPDVKDFTGEQQLLSFWLALEQSIVRVGEMKRKPKDFRNMDFLNALKQILSQCPLNTVLLKEEPD